MKIFVMTVIGSLIYYSSSCGMEGTYLQDTMDIVCKKLYEESRAGNAGSAQALDILQKGVDIGFKHEIPELGGEVLRKLGLLNAEGKLQSEAVWAIKDNIEMLRRKNQYAKFDAYMASLLTSKEEGSRSNFGPMQSNIHIKLAIDIACINLWKLRNQGKVDAGIALSDLQRSINQKIKIEGGSKDRLREFGFLGKDEEIVSDIVVEALIENIFAITLLKKAEKFDDYLEGIVRKHEESMNKQKELEGEK